MKNGRDIMPLKRYNIIIGKQDGYASARIEEGDNGTWVKYYDYDNLNRRREVIHRKLIETLEREKVLQEKISVLEQELRQSYDR